MFKSGALYKPNKQFWQEINCFPYLIELNNKTCIISFDTIITCIGLLENDEYGFIVDNKILFTVDNEKAFEEINIS